MNRYYSLALTLPLLSGWSFAADLSVKFELPQLNVAEYHRPYVAIWLERADQSVVSNLAVLYDIKKKDNGGSKWLKDLRQWWRKSGRELTLPVDGVSGATRTSGEQTISFAPAKAGLDKLPQGDYQMVIEAARESGGRELLRLPFKWPQSASKTVTARGKEELGVVSIQINP